MPIEKGSRVSTTTRGVEPRERLRQAHESIYRWPASFGPASFALVAHGPSGTVRGDARVAGGALTVRIDGDDDLAGWAEGEARLFLSHRMPRSFEEGDGRYALTTPPETGEADGTRIDVDDPLSSRYRLDNAGRIREITRAPGGKRFFIDVLAEDAGPGGTTLTRGFAVTYLGDDGAVERVDAYRDEYVEHGGVPVPAQRAVVTTTARGRETRILRFTAQDDQSEEKA